MKGFTLKTAVGLHIAKAESVFLAAVKNQILK